MVTYILDPSHTCTEVATGGVSQSREQAPTNSLGAQKYSCDDQRQERSSSHGCAAECQRGVLRGRLVRELSDATANVEDPAAVICPIRKPTK